MGTSKKPTWTNCTARRRILYVFYKKLSLLASPTARFLLTLFRSPTPISFSPPILLSSASSSPTIHLSNSPIQSPTPDLFLDPELLALASPPSPAHPSIFPAPDPPSSRLSHTPLSTLPVPACSPAAVPIPKEKIKIKAKNLRRRSNYESGSTTDKPKRLRMLGPK
ncbi:hypothetical protein [Absidia glauca]|uniref:Uncharacterized protein n=1 Tax=Absidia glauca TaxID=4829 RepID=A0A163L013_ABSGL|nr:hypothetical protein [Absidia glauca]